MNYYVIKVFRHYIQYHLYYFFFQNSILKMGNKNNRQLKLYCCYHQKRPERGYQCSNFAQYINPCCIHENSRGQNCNFKYIVWGNMLINSTILLLLISYVIQNLTDSILVYVLISIILIWIGFSKNFNFSKKQIEVLIIIVVVIIIIRMISKVLLFIMPPFIFSYWTILLGVLMFLYLYSIEREKLLVKNQLLNKQSTAVKIRKQEYCCICLDKKSTKVIFPCLHGCYCDNCILPLKKCSICRTNIHHVDFIKNFES